MSRTNAFCCFRGENHNDDDCCGSCRCIKRMQRRRRLLKDMTHRERLSIVSRYNFFGHGCIGLGGSLLVSLIVLVPLLSWDTMENSTVAAISAVLGMGIGSSFVLVCLESRRHFEYSRRVQTIDEELVETGTAITADDDLSCDYFDDESDIESKSDIDDDSHDGNDIESKSDIDVDNDVDVDESESNDEDCGIELV
eukprot:CAMPEP_0201125076 /NCGR_PEP_ID=MMETSP0850-20130426/19067_1 /ASSEMBLY_ACC=CAM_ASM_000622 /TAXON_ID=183588 /ORGANISM="Pseudo-nitzschia fraudulenta, Strain WWA7" /LENGTH=195 /DNA_ID=CAMNT_0047392871 /DNA_START=27 /DNA_END=614 /DNA_ORIENTATION=-